MAGFTHGGDKLPAPLVVGLLEVGLGLGALLRVESAQRQGPGELLEFGAGHGPASSASTAANFSIPSRTRVFTVPRGSPVRAAISRWVRPSK